MHYSCGQARPPQLDGSAIRSAIAPANVYRGSSVGCGANGSMQVGDKLDYYCFTVGNDGETWTYLSVYERGFAGWALDVYLPAAAVWCTARSDRVVGSASERTVLQTSASGISRGGGSTDQ
jgi:hypothetical protein